MIVAFAAPVLIQLIEHRPLIRIAYNGSVFAVRGARSAAPWSPSSTVTEPAR